MDQTPDTRRHEGAGAAFAAPAPNNAPASGRRHHGHLFFYLFLLSLAGALSDVTTGTAKPEWLSATALTAFVAGFVVSVEVAHQAGEFPANSGPPVRLPLRWTLVAVMAAIAVGSTIAWGSDWTVLCIFVVVLATFLPPLRYAPAAIGLVAAAAVASEMAHGLGVVSVATAASWALSIVMAGVITLVLRRRSVLIAELRAAQGQVARLAAADAVADERLRFARDLHDLLGHSLSLIVLKAELARRLLERGDDQGRAHTEVSEIEEAARRALVEVREAVAGYRAPSLAAELERGRSALSTAGVQLTADQPPAGLTPAADELLAWVVREAVTNVVRHSGARQVSISFAGGDGQVTLEVVDDGAGAATGWDWLSAVKHGSGLLGLQERVAAAGGRFAAGPAASGGFRVRAEVPLSAESPAPQAPAAPAERVAP